MSDVDPRRIDGVSAMSVLRRGIAASPELRVGMPQTVAMAMLVAGGKLLIPLFIDSVPLPVALEILDRVFTGKSMKADALNAMAMAGADVAAPPRGELPLSPPPRGGGGGGGGGGGSSEQPKSKTTTPAKTRAAKRSEMGATAALMRSSRVTALRGKEGL